MKFTGRIKVSFELNADSEEKLLKMIDDFEDEANERGFRFDLVNIESEDHFDEWDRADRIIEEWRTDEGADRN